MGLAWALGVAFLALARGARLHDTETWPTRQSQSPEKRLQRLECLRQDNLELLTDDEERYVLRQVFRGRSSSESLDAYVFCENLEVRALTGELQISRGSRPGEFNFSLGGGSGSRASHPASHPASVKLHVSGFQVITQSSAVDWLAYLISNQEVLRQGIDGNAFFRLSGQLRAVKRAGVWQVQLISGTLDHFEAVFPGQRVINTAIKKFGKTLLRDTVLKQMKDFIKQAVPADLLGAMTYMAHFGQGHETGYYYLEADLTLNGAMESSGRLRLNASLQVEAAVDADRLLEVLHQHFDPRQLAEEQVHRLLASVTTPDGLVRKLRKEVGWALTKEMQEKIVGMMFTEEPLAQLAPDLKEELLVRARRADIFQAIRPLIQARAAGKRGLLKDFQVDVEGTASWSDGQLSATLAPRAAFRGAPPRPVDAMDVGSGTAAPTTMLKMSRELLEPYDFPAFNVTMKGFDVHVRTLLEHGMSNWTVPAVLDQVLPELWAPNFSVKSGFAQLKSGKRIVMATDPKGLHVEAETAKGLKDPGWLTMTIAVAVMAHNSLIGNLAAHYSSSINLRPALATSLTPAGRKDFQYGFFTGLFWQSEQFTRAKTMQVMVLVNCNFLRIFDWPLVKQANSLTAHLKEVDLEARSDVSVWRGCVDLTMVDKSWGGLHRHYRFCGDREDVDGLMMAIKASKENGSALQRNREKTQDQRKLKLTTVVQQSAQRLPKPEAAPLKGREWSALQEQGSELHAPAKVARPAVWKGTGSLDLQQCRAEDALNLHWPPEQYSRVALRRAIPSALGDIFFMVKRLQLVSLDMEGRLRRASPTSFSLELSGPNGEGCLQLYAEGIEIHTPDSVLPELLHRAGHLEGLLRSVFSFGLLPPDSLRRGPLRLYFRLEVEFQLVGQHWEMKPSAVSIMRVQFGKGGAVQSAINHLIGLYGDLGQMFLDYVWPLLAASLPETLEKALRETSLQSSNEFSISARCQRLEDRCSDMVFLEVSDTSVLEVNQAAVQLESQVARLVGSYVSCSRGDWHGVAALGFAMKNQTAQVNVSTAGAAPMELLSCLLGMGESELRSLVKGSFSMQGPELRVPEAQVERIRLPVNGSVMEVSGTLSSLELDGLDASGASLDWIAALRGEMDLRREANGFVMKDTKSPQLSVDLSASYLRELYLLASKTWAMPRNVRSGEERLSDGKLPEQFQRPRAEAPERLDFAALLHSALGSAYARVAPAKAPVTGDAMVMFSTTLNFTNDVWRAALNRRKYDYGYVHLSLVGTWGMDGGTHQKALLQISCGRAQVFAEGAPFSKELHSHELWESLVLNNMDNQIVEIEWTKCWTPVAAGLSSPSPRFCAKAKDMPRLKTALELQFTRFTSARKALAKAQAADAESAKRTGRSLGGAHEVFEDSTWFRRYNALDDSSWSPEMPADVKVESPQQRWHQAMR